MVINSCEECEMATFDESLRLWWGGFSKYASSPIVFKDIEHYYEDCPSLKSDQESELFSQELILASQTTEWHLCKIQKANSSSLVCKRIYEQEEEYCAKHSKKCSVCDNREAINNEGYCSKHENKCAHCKTRINNYSTLCLNHARQCLTCSEKLLVAKDYCWKHQNYCLNSWRGCQERTAYANSSCSICRESNWCCNQRLPKAQINCSSCLEKQRVQQEQNKLKELVRKRTNLSNPVEVIRFEAPSWNNNLATVINGYHWVHLLVYDKESNTVRVFPSDSSETKWGIGNSREAHYSLASAQSEASWLRERMQYEANPILYIHPRANEYTYFSNLVCSPYVKIDYNASISDFKPLDIAWVRKRAGLTPLIEYYHVGVYVGNGDIIHLSGDNEGAGKVSWSTFLKGQTGELRRYHPIIPFKNYKQLIGEAVWAKDNNYGKNNYMLLNRNCEHLANMLVYGIYYSQQMAEFKENNSAVGMHAAGGLNLSLGCGLLLAPFTGGLSILVGSIAAPIAASVGAGMGAALNADIHDSIWDTFCLRNKLNNSSLQNKSDYETRELEERYEAQIEAPIKTGDCIIM